MDGHIYSVEEKLKSESVRGGSMRMRWWWLYQETV